MTGRDPERWVVSTEAPPELRALLEVARREGPSLAEQASLGSRLGLSMQQALFGLGAKGVALGTIALAGVDGVGLGLYTGRGAPPPQQAAPASAVVSVSSLEAPASLVEPAAAAETTPKLTDTVEAPAPPATFAAKPPSEAFLIRSAKSALPRNARLARAYLERHQRLYPQGQLAQEREVLLIEVLRLEGHDVDASARAAEFQQKNPGSAHRPARP
jgi:hypothetical protein